MNPKNDDEQGGVSVSYSSIEEAIKAWDTRPIEDDLRRQLAEMTRNRDTLGLHIERLTNQLAEANAEIERRRGNTIKDIVQLGLRDAKITLLEQKIAAMETRWHPANELPELNGHTCIEVEVAYYYADLVPHHCFFRGQCYYYPGEFEHGWEDGKSVRFEEKGFRIWYWRYLTPLPEIPASDGGSK